MAADLAARRPTRGTVTGTRQPLDVRDLTWPLGELGHALSAMATESHLTDREHAATPPDDADADRVHRWIDAFALQIGIEAEPTELRYDLLPVSLTRRAPLLLRLDRNGETRFMCVLSASARSVQLLLPTHRVKRVTAAVVHALLRAHLEHAAHLSNIERLAAATRIPVAEQMRLRTTYLRQAVGSRIAVDGWSIRLAPGSDFRGQLRRAGVPLAAAAFLCAQTFEYAGWVLSWWLFGRAALNGRVDVWLLAGWVLMLTTLVVVRFHAQRQQAVIAVGVGALLKRRLLDGALRLAPEETRTFGVGQLLGRTIESESIEVLALAGGFASVSALLQLIVAGVVIGGTNGGGVQVAQLIAWTLLILAVAWLVLGRRAAWVDRRLDLTHDLVETMVGYRTRLAQESPARWHVQEDRAVATYLGASRAMDRTGVVLAILPRGWLILGVLGLVPIVRAADIESRFAVAIAIGGVLLAYGALRQFTVGLTSLVDAYLAWKRVKVLFGASSRAVVAGRPEFAASDAAIQRGAPAPDRPRTVIEAHDVTFRYGRSREPVISGAAVQVRDGDRILLEGPSGSGKSTFASLLAGIRQPQSGTLLASGLDFNTCGEFSWRKRVVVAPQFHENHVFADTFLFNLLMGGRWPPERRDVTRALEVCRELGLGPLLDRMPGGVHQVVGDTGWQLSHGERSRLFVARALLQDAKVVIFDESFAALDPETLRECLRCVMTRAPAAIVIAHP
jgi:ATP-binding cassette, subfamily B, bacterial